jgi:hypothetical protein
VTKLVDIRKIAASNGIVACHVLSLRCIISPDATVSIYAGTDKASPLNLTAESADLLQLSTMLRQEWKLKIRNTYVLYPGFKSIINFIIFQKDTTRKEMLDPHGMVCYK